MPTIKLDNAYNSARPIAPCLNNKKLSRPKLENVVKPPRIPTIKNRRASCWSTGYFWLQAKKIPAHKQPKILIHQVGQGNCICGLNSQSPAAYRRLAPIAPPIATQSQPIFFPVLFIDQVYFIQSFIFSMDKFHCYLEPKINEIPWNFARKLLYLSHRIFMNGTGKTAWHRIYWRSEEHTSELQSREK